MSSNNNKPVRRKWQVTAGGTVFYILAANEPKAVEVAESHLGIPPGSIAMECQLLPECFAPVSGGWLL